MNETPWWFQDQTFGWFLIAAGVAALLFQPFDKLDAWLGEQGDYVISWIIVIMAIVFLMIAWKGDAKLKVLAAAWMISP